MYAPILSQRDEVVGAIPPPPGITPNFVDPPSIAHLVINVIIVFTTISAVFTALRFYTALSIIRHVRLDDYLLTAAWFSALLYSILNSINTKYGLGRHMWDITFSTLNPRFMMFGAISGSFFGLSIMLTKLSILTFFLRFVDFGKLRIVILAIMVIVVLYTLVGSFDWLYSCQPLEKYWDLTIIEGSCIHWLEISIFSCAMNTATDVAILILPVFVLRNLHLPTKQRIGIIIVFMTGGFVLVITIIKLKLTVDLASKTDITWEIVTSNIWWTVEVHLSIVCACLPALKPFLGKYMPRVIGSSRDTSTRAKRRTVPSSYAQSRPSGGAGDDPLDMMLQSNPNKRSPTNASSTTAELGTVHSVRTEYASDRGLIITEVPDAENGEP